jgi:CRISPR-associated protein Cst2
MLKHIQAEHLYEISRDQGLPLCAACTIFDANRMSADENFRVWLKKDKPTPIQVVDRLLTCTLDDAEGNLITEGQSTPRKSVIEFGWAVGLPDAVTTDQYFHVKYDPDRKEIPSDKTEREGNLGQAIFHRPANSGQYAIVCNVEAQRIGYNDVSQKYTISPADRRKRLAAVLQSLAYTFVQPNGAMRNTQNPHIVDVRGALTYSTGPAPAPLLSPLNRTFADQMVAIAASLNTIHAGRLVVERFGSLAELVAILTRLMAEGDVYTPKV